MKFLCQSYVCYLLMLSTLACLACAAILYLFLRTGWAWKLATDIPNQRSLHTRITPRMGGLGIVPVVALSMMCLTPSLRWVAVGMLLLAVVSYGDDRWDLPARYRLATHIAMVALLLMTYPFTLTVWMLGLAVFCVWMINLYNFMDGANGLAGGMSVFGFTAYAVAAASTQTELALACAVLAGASLGFLLFNFPHARLFLGDVGSTTLGYLAGALGLLGWHWDVWPIWFPPLVFSSFIADASVTLLRRFFRGERVWLAHREHYYQRMIRMGWSHQRTTLAWYGLMLLSMMLALVGLSWPGSMQIMMLVGWGATLILLGWRIDRRWQKSPLSLGSKEGRSS